MGERHQSLWSAKLVDVLQDFLKKNTLAASSRELMAIYGQRDFSEFVRGDNFLSRVLGFIVLRRPWAYWDPELLRIALRTLESNTERSIQSISAHLDVCEKLRGITQIEVI